MIFSSRKKGGGRGGGEKDGHFTRKRILHFGFRAFSISEKKGGEERRKGRGKEINVVSPTMQKNPNLNFPSSSSQERGKKKKGEKRGKGRGK